MAPAEQNSSSDEASLSERRQDLAKRAFKGTIWVTVGFGSAQVIRLGSNLVLTRLLAPELFGLMALVNAFLSGLQMFSDVGLAPSLIQSKNGEKEEFLSTGWTLQTIRGGSIALVACAIAPLVAAFFEEPKLTPLIWAAALGPLMSGFWSTRLITEKRDLRMHRITVLQFLSQLGAVAVSVLWALVSPSVWALVAGSITAAALNLIGGYILLPSRRHRFAWHRESLTELTRFGRWIFVATVCGFFANHADRFIVGKLFTMQELGVYSIAMMMVGAGRDLFSKFKESILLPVFSNVRREQPERFALMVRRARITLLKFAIPALVALVVLGDVVVLVLFDPRYEAAGWLLQFLAAALLVEMCQETGPVLLSHGDSFLMTKIIATKAAFQLLAMLLGGIYAGQLGLVVGILLSRLLSYPLIIIQNRKYGVWFWKLDLAAHGISAALILVLLQLRNVFFG